LYPSARVYPIKNIMRKFLYSVQLIKQDFKSQLLKRRFNAFCTSSPQWTFECNRRLKIIESIERQEDGIARSNARKLLPDEISIWNCTFLTDEQGTEKLEVRL
jgi:hypothetical protein